MERHLNFFAIPDRRQTRNDLRYLSLLHVIAFFHIKTGTPIILVKSALQIFGSVNVFSYPFKSFLFISYHISYNFMSFDVISHHLVSLHVISHHLISLHVISHHLISLHVTSCHFMSLHVISYHFVSISLASSSLMEPWETILFDLCEAHNVTIVPLASICIWDSLGGLYSRDISIDKSWNKVVSLDMWWCLLTQVKFTHTSRSGWNILYFDFRQTGASVTPKLYL